MQNTIYKFDVEDVNGQSVSMDQFKGKVMLVINTASKCGFTPQLAGMAEVHEKFKDQGFSVIAFPSNDFGGQEPLEGTALEQFCQTKYKSTYPVFNKINVKGDKAAPIFKFLSNKSENGKFNSKPKWNFHKYLIDREGRVVDYFVSFTKPNSGKVQKAIEKLL